MSNNKNIRRKSLAVAVAGMIYCGLSFGVIAGELISGRNDQSPVLERNDLGLDTTREVVDFNSDVRPIFNSHCIACHGGVKQAANLSFIRRTSFVHPAESGEIPVKPGDAEHSELIRRITAGDEERMPPREHGKRLTAGEIDTLRRWVAQGAKWGEHWAYVAPVKPELPKVKHGEWCLGPIDRFVLAKVESAGLNPTQPASRRAWLRRVSFDLIGLPPTAEELENFLLDNSPRAYEKVVDRLLDSPAYGERWTSMWLDLSRYADTVGFERDPHRNIWPFKDWLIRAFNADMPFDQFTIKQLAGDLLDRPTIDDLVATAFHRNTQTNTEGGTDDEEFRVQAVIDRVNTTWQVWQSTTFGCTQCHSHPYAPFDHEEYYKFMAILNNTRDSDVIEELPLLAVPLNTANNLKASAYDYRISQLRRSLFGQFSGANRNANWHNLAIDRASINQQGSARLRIASTDGITEVFSEGTIANDPTYMVEAPLPKAVERVAAIRIDVLPIDLEGALRTPEAGFVLSHLKGFVVPAEELPERTGEQPPNDNKHGEAAVMQPAAVREIEFQAVFADEPEPLIDPDGSLEKGRFGWSQYTRIWKPTSAVFLLRQPVTLKPTDRLRLTLRQSVSTDGALAMLIRRGRFFVSADERWSSLVANTDFNSQRTELAAIRKNRAKIQNISIPIAQELSTGSSRHTYQFERGSWLNKGEEVQPDTPAILATLPKDVPHDRLAMARWLVSKENPLTARVMVNRLWAEVFGVGIVETLEDFGSSGQMPSHPELLDYLAIEFRDNMQWSMKRLLKEIVLSATYRQDGKASKELNERDPANRLLAHGPRKRLSAEMVRDQALAVSGLLSRKMYGPPVMPPQPEGVWRSVYSGDKWIASQGEDRYRRAVYTYWKRTSGYPSMMAFDAPSREVCTARRIATNTPLQALATLNDEAQMEFAEALAKRMETEGGKTIEDQARWAYTVATDEEPSAAAVDELTALFDDVLTAYRDEAEMSKKIAKSPEMAAKAMTANAILNLDATLTK